MLWRLCVRRLCWQRVVRCARLHQLLLLLLFLSVNTSLGQVFEVDVESNFKKSTQLESKFGVVDKEEVEFNCVWNDDEQEGYLLEIFESETLQFGLFRLEYARAEHTTIGDANVGQKCGRVDRVNVGEAREVNLSVVHDVEYLKFCRHEYTLCIKSA